MKALIDIKTPAGKSLEGFPIVRAVSNENEAPYLTAIGELLVNSYQFVKYRVPRVHNGHVITIQVIE